jgi:hypothetical protein
MYRRLFVNSFHVSLRISDCSFIPFKILQMGVRCMTKLQTEGHREGVWRKTIARNINLKVPVYLNAKQGYTVRKMEKDK